VFFMETDELKKINLEICGEVLHVYGHSYFQREIREPIYDDLVPDREDGIHILMAHGGDSQHAPMNYKKLGNSGFHYIALGHIHRPGIYEGYPMAYAGALEPLDVNDIGIHGYMEGEICRGIDGTYKTGVRFVPAAKRSYIHLEQDISGIESQYELEARIRESMAASGVENLFKIILKGTRQGYFVPDLSRIGNLEHAAAVEDISYAPFDYEQLKDGRRGQLVGEFLWGFEGEELSEVHSRARELGLEALLRN